MTHALYAFAATLLALAGGFLLLQLMGPRKRPKPLDRRDPTRGFRDPCR